MGKKRAENLRPGETVWEGRDRGAKRVTAVSFSLTTPGKVKVTLHPGVSSIDYPREQAFEVCDPIPPAELWWDEDAQHWVAELPASVGRVVHDGSDVGGEPELGERSSIVLVGDIAAGHTFVGPFATGPEAVEYANELNSVGMDWHVASLQLPAEFARSAFSYTEDGD